jgi:ferrous iron transport protein B
VTESSRSLVITPARPPAMKSTCHAGGSFASAGPDAPVVALAGAPNSGKSTLFNALTGARVTMGNWPGTTVEVSRGVWRTTRQAAACTCVDCNCEPSEERIDITLVDLPGAYSLRPESPDEALTRELLVDAPPEERPDVCVVLVDASRLAHGLYLVSQVRERSQRVVVALTMLDIASRRGISVDAGALERSLGCPVVGIDPRRRSGLDALSATVRSQFGEPEPPARARPLASADSPAGDALAGGARPDAPAKALDADTLDSETLDTDTLDTDTLDADTLAADDERFGWIAAAVTSATTEAGAARASMSDRIDRWATAPVIGPLLFLGVMWVVFQVTINVAAPFQDALDSLFSGPVSDGATALLAAVGLADGWLHGLLVKGLIAGVGMLLTFVPLMTFMFILLALLEDSGYLARAAVVTNRLMRAIGLPGRAFLPLIVGYGCNVPAVSATRILPSATQRIMTSLLVPFTSCTARLTVFVMLGATFFGPAAGTVVFGMYVASIVIIVGVGLLLRVTIWRGEESEPLVIDLPAYQVPTLRLTASVTWLRLKGFLQTAAGIIVLTVCAVWLLQSLPVRGDGSFGNTPVEDSAYGVAAQAITPVFAPAGFGSWQTTSTLVVGFVAKEAVISSWAQTYAVDEPEDSAAPGDLGAKVMAEFEQSSGGHPIPAALAFMVFLMAYTPCVATLAAQWREIGGRWTVFGIGLQLAVAWLLAVAVFQVGSLFW